MFLLIVFENQPKWILKLDLEKLTKFLRKQMESSESNKYYPKFVACNITKIFLKWFIVVASSRMTELLKVAEQFHFCGLDAYKLVVY